MCLLSLLPVCSEAADSSSISLIEPEFFPVVCGTLFAFFSKEEKSAG